MSAQRSQEGRTAAGRSPAGVGRHPAGLRFALIGCGFWAGAAHVPALRSLSGVDISACVGADAAEGAAFAREHGIPSSYSTIRELLAAERPDAVVVASPNDTHCEAIEVSLSAGAGVFCEKPLANRGSDAWRAARAGRASGLPCTVGFSFRYSPAIQAIRNDLRSGRFGQLWLVEVAVCNSQFHPIGGKPMNWKGDPSHAGQVLSSSTGLTGSTLRSGSWARSGGLSRTRDTCWRARGLTTWQRCCLSSTSRPSGR